MHFCIIDDISVDHIIICACATHVNHLKNETKSIEIRDSRRLADLNNLNYIFSIDMNPVGWARSRYS